MREVHPAFDPATSTWFVGAKEARTIRELLVKLGGPDKVCAIGYKPIGAAAPLIIREPHNPKHLAMRQAQRVTPTPMKALDPLAILPPKPNDERKRYATKEERCAKKNERRRAKRVEHRVLLRAADIEKHLPPVPAEWLSPVPALPWVPGSAKWLPPTPALDKTFGVGIGFPARAATAQERDQWTEIENVVLDLWAEGKSGPDIAKALNVKVEFVSSNVVWKARIAGDPRAVVRCPNAIGKPRNRPKHNGHISSRNRNYARIVELARNADGGTDKA